MQVEIDQGGKIEQLNTHTVVALSNNIQTAIYITAKEKSKLYFSLRKTIIRRRDQNAMVFAVLVCLLLEYSKKNFGSVYVDIEYSGKNDIIENTIKKISKIKLPDINFKLVGKSSKAHELGINIYRRKDKSKCKVIDANEILKLLGF